MATMVKSKYQSNNGAIHPIRLRAETAAVVNADAPTGAVTNPVRVKISKSKREAGIRCRGLNISRTRTSGDVSVVEYAFLPILTPTAWADYDESSTITYKGVTWNVAGLVSEDIN